MFLTEHFVLRLQVYWWFLESLEVEWEADPLVIRLLCLIFIFIGHCTCTLQQNLSSAFNPFLIGIVRHPGSILGIRVLLRAICGIRTWPLVSPPEHKPPVLTTRPPLP
ncbi:hypothetical protein ILYODFUR_028850 [Ilyodon furcidens]|uniref:Uncharacterized protein n=1 Tax=Ilyodon furcidens TaxID=33524 RepID=A0ABV0V8U3_9TELE